MNPATQSKSIVWLHLSDLHLCEPKTGWDAHRVLDPLIKDLRHMEKEHGLLPQLIFFTGDAAFGNFGSEPGSTLPEQYQGIETLLSGVRKAFTVEIHKANLFLVPGNHDVDRNEATEPLTTWIEQQTNPEKITELIKSGNKQWKQFMERLTFYRQFLQDHHYTHLLNDPERLIYAEAREINGVKIGVGGFNSAWNCCRDNEKGKLWLGGNWQNGTIVRKLKEQNADINLALIHHPPGWFVEQEDNRMRIQMERDFDFFLHGHEHQGWVNASTDGHIRIAAAACYESADQENGYNFVRLNLETGEAEIWLRKFDDDGGGWIPRVIGNKKTTNDGLWLLKDLQSLKKFKKSASPRYVSNDDFIQIVRDKVKRILETGKPAALALRGALQKNQPPGSAPEQVLIPNHVSISPESAIREWRKTVQASLEEARDHLADIKQCASDIMGWLILLCVDGTRLQRDAASFIDLDKAAEIVIPVKTQAGTEVFVARLQERPAKFQLKGTDKALGEGYVDPADLELGLLKPDCLLEIQKLVYIQVFKKGPALSDDWLGRLRHTLELDDEDKNKMYYLTLPRTRHSELIDTIKQLKADLPHLRILITGTSDSDGDSILIMDESRLEALVLAFLTTLAEFS